MNTTSTAQSWNAHYAEGRGIRPLSEAEIHIVRHTLAPPEETKEPRPWRCAVAPASSPG
ncbi:hypothetical protein ACFTZK_18695 [Streptomyces decoyicus]|uniref:hypothetical protein n=1 Tax=Streptomyces decoyicus TaxID=249567 RepID=UPI00362B1085